MVRPLRIEYPGAVYHVTSRGNARAKIFRTESDKRTFLDLLFDAVTRFHLICYAYCLMNNHYHLLLETPEGNLSKSIRHLNGVYTQRFNRKYSRPGHVFQGRYKAFLVDRESYLLELCRYVVLNPIRAKLVETPEKYRWTSYRATGGIAACPSFLSREPILSRFSDNQERAMLLYRTFVMEGITLESPWKNLKGQLFLGDDRFVETAKAYRLEVSTENPRSQRYANRPALTELLSGIVSKTIRNGKIGEAHLYYGYTLKQIAECLNLHYTTVSKIVRDQVMNL